MWWFGPLTLTSLAVLASFGRHVTQAGVQVPRVRGVPVSKSSLYSPDRDFECLDGSLQLPYSRLNDDYCDCGDGSDEPGTAACANGSFYCQNSGYQALYIPSSRVNDGVCDCCDASDEYASNIQCVDNCHELRRKAWLEAQRAAELAKEGNKIRLEYIALGKQLSTENKAKLAKLRIDYDEAELIKKERENEKTVIEEREALALEKYKSPPQSEEQAKAENQNSAEEAAQFFQILDSDKSGTITVVELQTRATFDKDHNGEVSKEEALYFLNNQEEITQQEFIDFAWANVKPFLMLEKGVFKPAENVEREHLDDIEVGEGEEEEDLDEEGEDVEDQGRASEFEETGQAPETEAAPEPPQYDEETQAIVDEASRIRDRYREAERSLQELQTEIQKLEERTERDYGSDNEFASLDGQCFEHEDLEYVYSFCPYGRTSQRSKNGGSEVSLGQWHDWVGPSSNRYSMAKFDRGHTCWNGPARTCLVTLRCGVENKLLQVSEPSRCEYAMEFATPALCNPESNVSGKIHDEL
ncbi:PREDICTED: glucosidase 2 subunit beta [Ceratosolen solmsi marchali]|uniref:Glucosidase 2 subunit beta n=1 Tax=Ceratosolen solmsi marchali TaxID=326594 RepID=A0AAJ6YNY5_9HYME|nr:PREDICTED: glucosidase 2 subunit beta [Ceratosolen solmsi marchali]